MPLEKSGPDAAEVVTRPDPSDYSQFERDLAQKMNEQAYAPHEESWAKDEWPDFLPQARRAINALIEMGVSLER